MQRTMKKSVLRIYFYWGFSVGTNVTQNYDDRITSSIIVSFVVADSLRRTSTVLGKTQDLSIVANIEFTNLTLFVFNFVLCEH